MPDITRMDWTQTASGRQFLPLRARAEDVHIEDIAHALSLLCRFNGHCSMFYSVAEHCVRVSNILPKEFALWGLMHDAAEAYLGDMPRPVKDHATWFVEAEDRLLQVIIEKYGMVFPMPDDVVRADEILLATEARDLMAPPPFDWGLVADPLPETIEPLSPTEAKTSFLLRFAELHVPSVS